MSLRWKIALALGALAALATIAVGMASYRSTRDRLYAEVDESLANAVTLVPVNGGDVARLPPRGPLDVYETQWLDRRGNVRFSTFDPVAAPAQSALDVIGSRRESTVDTVSIDGVRYRVRTVGFDNGALQVARPLDETDRVLDSLRTRTALIVVLVTASAVLVGLLVAGRVTASLRRLTGAAETVGTTGRFDVEVPTDGSDEVGRLGVAFSDMLGSLEQSRAAQQRLVQDAGHELRTPLTSLRTNLDVLRRHPDLAPDQRAHVIDDMHAETEQLVELVNEIVAVASGANDDEPATRFSLGAVAAEVAERYQRRTGRTVTVTADESSVLAQRGAVQRAISNLLDNARKFDVSGGPIEVRVDGDSLWVLDRGPGIAAGELELVFDRFHRADEARTLPGSGLGLSIVRDVVERQGGTVSAGNRVGGGAVVGFTLPAATDALPAPMAPQPSHAAPPTSDGPAPPLT